MESGLGMMGYRADKAAVLRSGWRGTFRAWAGQAGLQGSDRAPRSVHLAGALGMRKSGLVTAGYGAVLGVFLAPGAFAEPLDVFRDCEVCPEMIELPLGEFVMGAPEDEFRNNYEIYFPDEGEAVEGENNPAVIKSEGPQHRVIIDLRVAMSKNEVAFEEWMACVDAGGCGGYVPRTKVGATGSPEEIRRARTDPRFIHTPSESKIAEAMTPAASIEEAADNPRFLEISGRYPVIRVSYLDAQAYVTWLNQTLETDAYRLPTEAEWEYAARAGTTTRFAQGFEPKPEQANISGEATEDFLQQDRPDLRTLGHPVPVDELDAASPWGLRHMSGNVGEITLSCYTDHYEGWSTASEWLESSFRESCDRVERGGSFADPMSRARVAYRFKERLINAFGSAEMAA